MTTVLVYHSISSPPDPLPSAIDISPARFERQLRWLSRRRVVPLADTLSGGTNRTEIAITFDDGFRDNLTTALPLLERFGLPMTLFVTAGFVNQQGYLSELELREMAKHRLVTIGAHGLWHLHFNRLSLDEARHELTESRTLLESIVGQKVDLLAWPFGECDEQLELLSADCGYRAAWSVWKGSNGAYSRWRVPLGHWDNFPRFVAKASGVYAATKAKWHRYRSGREQSHTQTGWALPAA